MCSSISDRIIPPGEAIRLLYLSDGEELLIFPPAGMIELVIFDCDGVLVDSERLAVKIDVQVLARLGWHLTEAEVVSRFVGVSDAHFRREVEAYLGRELDDEWEAEFQPLYRQAFQAELCPVDGIVEALERIPYPTCVASSGTHEKMRLTLGLTGLYERFAGRIFSATEVARGKPAPDLFLHAAERMGARPDGCVVVEDSAHGAAAARAAGMRVLAYGGGVTPPERLTGPRTTVFQNMRELPDLLAALDGRLGGGESEPSSAGRSVQGDHPRQGDRSADQRKVAQVDGDDHARGSTQDG